MRVSPSPHQGILLLVGATACFAGLDTSSKIVGAAVPVAMAMWARYTFQAVVTGSVMLPVRGRAMLRCQHPWLQALRALLFVVSGGLGFMSLQFLPLGEFTALLMLTPLAITVVSALAMGEQVAPVRWLLLAGGFVGALLVIRPGAEDFNLGMLLPLALVGVNAGFQLVTSRLAALGEHAGTTHLLSGALASLSLTIALPLFWTLPPSTTIWWGLAMMGIFSTLGHFLLILAYSRASPATLSPFLYTHVGFGALSGWLVFSHAPDALALAGIAIITLCGIAATRLSPKALPLAD